MRSSRPSLLKMPDAVLAQIFSYLPVRDRKNIRLACQHFNEICDFEQVQQTEEIVLRNNKTALAAIQTLSDSKRKVTNIRFYDTLIDTSISEFIRIHGGDIQSLAFYNCLPLEEIDLLRDIIQKCPNLRSLSFVIDIEFISSAFVWRKWPRNIIKYNILDNLETFWNDRIVFRDVQNLALTLSYPKSLELIYPITKEKFSVIFKIFPNIKILNLSVAVDQYFDSENLQRNLPGPTSAFTFPVLCDQLSKLRQLRILSLRIIAKPDRYGFATETGWNTLCSTELKELRQLSVNLLIPPENYGTVFTNIFSAYKNLTNFDCIIENPSSDHIELILSNAPKLRRLRIRCNYRHYFRMSDQCFKAIVRSNLIIFSIYSFSERKFLKCSIDSYFPFGQLPNKSMKELELYPSNKHCRRLFSHYFRNAKYLVLHPQIYNVFREMLNIPLTTNLYS